MTLEEWFDVWEVHPHLNTDYDYAIFDDHNKAIEYAKQVVASFIDDAQKDEMEIKIKHSTMTRYDFEESGGGFGE